MDQIDSVAVIYTPQQKIARNENKRYMNYK